MIKNSIETHRFQHIQRQFYYTTMQKLCKFEANLNSRWKYFQYAYFTLGVSLQSGKIYLVNVATSTKEAFYNISMYLYNKNVLEYAQIVRSGSKSRYIRRSL